jgi:hypothetical protein
VLGKVPVHILVTDAIKEVSCPPTEYFPFRVEAGFAASNTASSSTASSDAKPSSSDEFQQKISRLVNMFIEHASQVNTLTLHVCDRSLCQECPLFYFSKGVVRHVPSNVPQPIAAAADYVQDCW